MQPQHLVSKPLKTTFMPESQQPTLTPSDGSLHAVL